jgi:hypothetical protein
MLTCRDMKNLFEDALLGELDSDRRAALEAHLSECESCSREFERCRAFMDLMAEYRRPEPGKEYWDRWEEKLEQSLAGEGSSNAHEFAAHSIESMTKGRFLLYWKHIAAAASIFAAAALLWTVTDHAGRRDSIPAVQMKVSPAYVSVELEAKRYLDRSKLVLMGMRTFDPEEAETFRPSFARESAISRQLISESASLKERLSYSRQIRLRGLVDDLDVVLLQIANLGREYDTNDLKLIQLGMERKSLLFKINLEDMISSLDDRYETRSTNNNL